MKRREYIKTFLLGSALPVFQPGELLSGVTGKFFAHPAEVSFESDWHLWPDMNWAGPRYWGNRLQDWLVRSGELICDYSGPDRSLHILTLLNSGTAGRFDISCKIRLLNNEYSSMIQGCIGMVLGAKGPFDDYRSAAVFGKGLPVGLGPAGELLVGDQTFQTGFPRIPAEFSLHVHADGNTSPATMHVEIRSFDDTDVLFARRDIHVANESLTGNFALLAACGTPETQLNASLAAFFRWKITGEKLYENEAHLFGPVCFAQYTLHDRILKLTAQCSPLEMIANHRIDFQLKENDTWTTQESSTVQAPSRAVHFRVENWQYRRDIPYRVVATIPVGDTRHQYIYEGTVAHEPLENDTLRTAVFSCNAHYGFPDSDIPESLRKIDYDMCVFLGDQFYESTGGFGPQYTGEFDKTCLDYLRKWMMFGWSYREIFRHKPCAIIPDDHDVYHGNVWGESGKRADTTLGYGSKAQDTGGYKMPPEWVNMIQFTQTSHLPDPVDPEPVSNGIGVYFTHWRYGGISFAILEDRKFKSAPLNVLPEEAQVFNGWLHNKEFDIREYNDIEAELLGPRQEKFLEEWAGDWSQGVMMKAVLSQTNFATVATLPADALDDGVVPSLEIPEKGQYVKGDLPTVDMDSNGWPVKKRNKAVALMRKGFAFHIAGDQHLATFIQYGLANYESAGFAFAGPALNNLWPRRFWPPVKDTESHTVSQPAYTGNHQDGFGNKFTLHAVANPYNAHQEPAILHNRANGYGIVTFDKINRTITTDCYRRFEDPSKQGAQYPGWPVIIRQEDNGLKNASFRLPKVTVSQSEPLLPVLKIFDESGELAWSLRMPALEYSPAARKPGNYRIVIENEGERRDLGLHAALPENPRTISVKL